MQAADAVNRFSKKFWSFGGVLGNDGAKKVIRATDAKEVGVENPSEETFCRPDQRKSVSGQFAKGWPICQPMNLPHSVHQQISRDIRARIPIFPRSDRWTPSSSG